MSVIIHGGGISGVILALMLSKFVKDNLNINLIEIHSPDGACSVHDSRYIALSRTSYYKLISCGLSPILSSFSTPIKQIEITDSIHQNKVVLSASDYNIPEFGYVIKLYNLKSKIFDLLRGSSSIKLFCPATLQNIKRHQDSTLAILDNGHEICGQLLIAADGSYSSLATLCGMQWDFFDYKQIAIIANIVTTYPHEGRAFEIFTPYGSLALLPISKDKSSLIWCIPSSYKTEILNLNSREFCKGLQKVFGWELGCILDVDKRYYFSLFLRRARYHISHRLALVGNAAQTLHPIAGQGFNLGLRDIFNISKIISHAHMKDMDIGNDTILKLYQKNRQLDQLRIIAMTHGLVYLFSNACCPLIFSRSCALTIMKYSWLLRNILVKMILSW